METKKEGGEMKIQASYLDPEMIHGKRVRLEEVDNKKFAVIDENGQYIVTAVYEEEFIVFVDLLKEDVNDFWGGDTEVSITNIDEEPTIPGKDWGNAPITRHEITNNGDEDQARLQSMDNDDDDEVDIDENEDKISGLFFVAMALDPIPKKTRVNLQTFNNRQIALPADDGEYMVHSNIRGKLGVLVAPYKDEKRIKERQLANRYLLGRLCGVGRESKSDFISPQGLKELRDIKRTK